jgi:molybdopterin/thiamine biosynthesis adenylyltransferase
MIEIVFPAEDIEALQKALLGESTELCAVLYAQESLRADGTKRFLIRDIDYPSSSDYTHKSFISAELRPEFVARITKKARKESYAIVFAHSHPGPNSPQFSDTDNKGEELLSAFLAHRHPEKTHLALVVSAGGMRARCLGSKTEVRVISVGSMYKILFDPESASTSDLSIFDRQVRAFGNEGQKAIQRLRVAIVGLGGTGSLIAQQLVHLGVRDFILIDPDTIEATNLNRVANAMPSDVGRSKVEIAAKYIHAFASDATVKEVSGDIIRAKIARELVNADVIFGCTDSHGSRAVLQQISYQYLIPCFDMGSTIVVNDGQVTHIYGRVQMLAPGHACFTCDGLLDAAEVRRDMMTAFERKADPYIQGAREPAPAVMSINSTVSSLAVTMFLSAIAGIPSGARHILYDGVSTKLRNVRAQPDSNCYICSRNGALAQGDAWPLFARQD